jgi:hypothetical protein
MGSNPKEPRSSFRLQTGAAEIQIKKQPQLKRKSYLIRKIQPNDTIQTVTHATLHPYPRQLPINIY